MTVLMLTDGVQAATWTLDAEAALTLATFVREGRSWAARNGLRPSPALQEIEAVLAGLSRRASGHRRTNADNSQSGRQSSGEMDDPLLTTAQAALRVGVTERTIRRWRYDGAIESVRIGGRVLYTESSIDAMRRPA